MKRIYTIWVHWDDDAKVWFVQQSDIPGLVIEAPTAEALVQNIRNPAADLIELNASDGPKNAPLELLWSGSQSLDLAPC